MPLPSPNACRWCGIDEHHHGLQYIEGHGLHSWEQPTNNQINTRMTARRTAQKGTP